MRDPRAPHHRAAAGRRQRRPSAARAHAPARRTQSGPGRASLEGLESRTLFAIAPAGPEFQVNAYEPGNQIYPAVASDADGDFVVAWESNLQDGSGYGVYAQRYNAAGEALGGPIQANTTTFGQQFGASVASDDAGNFVVAWATQGQDGSGYGIFAQRFAADGTRLGTEFQVNTFTAGDQTFPSVDMDSDGDFVIAWQSDDRDGDTWGVSARRFTSAGAPVGDEVQVNTTTVGIQAFPSVALQDNGDFVVAFHSSPSPTAAVGTFDVRARDFVAASGTFNGNDRQLNTFIPGDQAYPDVDAGPLGSYVVTWRSDGQDGDGAGVYAYVFDNTTRPQAPEFQVNTTTAGDQSFPAVAVDDVSGEFVVTWHSDNQDAPGGRGVYVRQYDGVLNPVPESGEVQVNQFTAGSQEFPDIAVDDQGDYVVAWSSEDQDEVGGYGIFARQLESFTADTTAPTVDIVDVTPDPRETPVDSITIVFSEPVTGFDLSDLQLFRDAEGNVLPGSGATLTTTDGRTYVLGNLAGVTDEAGDYVLFIDAETSGVTDGTGNPLNGDAQDAFRVNAVVLDRNVFYNNSSFDGNSAAATAGDDNAIATDKEALLPGETASFENYTSYYNGINGVMIDVRNLPDEGVTAADFRFRVGDNNDPSTWTEGPAPTSITVREGAGQGGSDRITITFADRAIRNTWLEVTFIPTSRTGVEEGDVFYFGNIQGEIGDDPNRARINALDIAGTYRENGATSVPVTNRYDFNRDGRVNALDIAAVRQNQGAEISLISPPGDTGPAPTATSLLFGDAAILA